MDVTEINTYLVSVYKMPFAFRTLTEVQAYIDYAESIRNPEKRLGTGAFLDEHGLRILSIADDLRRLIQK